MNLSALWLFLNGLSVGGGASPGNYSDDTLVWPDETNTGYANAPGYPGSLSAGPGTISGGTTHTFKMFQGGAIISAGASNVEFFGCCFQGYAPDTELVHILGDNITFKWCTFRPDSGSAGYRTYASGQCYQYSVYADDDSPAHTLLVEHCDLWGFGNAFQVNGSNQTKPHIFRHNWFHHAADNDGTYGGTTNTYHHDGILCTWGGAAYSYAIIDHNTFESYGNTNGIAMQLDSGSAYNHITCTRNKLSGWGYGVQIGGNNAGNDNNVMVDNVWSTRLQVGYGPLYGWTGTNRTWRRNRWSVPAVRDYGNLADDGKYWVDSGPQVSDSAEGVTYPYYCTQIRATPGTGNASVEFTAPNDNGGTSIAAYVCIAYNNSASAVATQTGTSSPILVTLPSGAYTFTVFASNSAGNGFESNPCGEVDVT